MGTPWDFNPLFSGVIGIYHVMIMGQPNANLSSTPSFAGLQNEDQLLADELALSWAVIEDGLVAQAGSPGVAPPPPTDSSIARVVSEHKDSDNDAVPDVLELTYATDPYNPDSDGDGASDGAETLQGTDPNDAGYQPDDSTRPTGGPIDLYGAEQPQVGPYTIETVSLHFCCKHHGRWTICPDDKSIPDYKEPQWKKDSHNWPSVWTKKSTPVISATFKLPGVPETSVVMARAEGSEDRDLDPKPCVYAGNDTWRKPKHGTTTKWNDHIDFYNAQADPPAGFELTWHVKVNSSPEVEVATTRHTVYVTLGRPTNGITQETVFNIGCSNAKGMNRTLNTEDQIIDTIYGIGADGEGQEEFRSLHVPKVIPASGNRRQIPMYYWGEMSSGLPDHPCQSVAELLKFGDGNCGTWADLFRACLVNQSIPVNRVKVVPAAPQELVIWVKNHQFAASPTGSNQSYPWIEDTDFWDSFDGIWSQGYADPPQRFGNHYIVRTGSGPFIYDPSYGSRKFAEPTLDDQKQAYQDESVDGVGVNPTPDVYWGARTQPGGPLRIQFKN